MKLLPYLLLVRPANVITAISDIIAGAAIAGIFIDPDPSLYGVSLLFLGLSTCGLYAGGIVFNDFFDFEIDQIERPERPIPSGQVSLKQAFIFGSNLLLWGIIFGFLAGPISGAIALGIAACALIYDKLGKHHAFLGPLNMGLCRGLNLMLGMSVVSQFWQSTLIWICLLPIVFVAAITLTSRGEVSGNNRASISLALALDLLIAGLLIFLGWQKMLDLWIFLPFALLWVGMNFRAKFIAITVNTPQNIMNAVKTGVISLIPLNAAYTAGFGHWTFGIAVLILLPLASLLARKFAVT